jgi:hypothetical protein
MVEKNNNKKKKNDKRSHSHSIFMQNTPTTCFRVSTPFRARKELTSTELFYSTKKQKIAFSIFPGHAE